MSRLHWKEIVQNYIIKHSNRIKKTTHPLQQHFGIGYFTYHRIDEKGNYTVLVDRPDWAEYYVNEKIFLNDPYLRLPSVYKSGLATVESHGTDDYKKTILKSGKKILQMDMGIVLIQKNEKDVEFFGFAGSKHASALQNIYLNQQHILYSFAKHFKREMNLLLIQMESEAGSLLQLKGQDSLCTQPIYPDVESSACLAYYKQLGMQGGIEKLSPREKECLKWLLKNKSAKETAFILGLSKRTVESYFENIKDKLCCDNKIEVLKKARSLEEMDLLT